MGYVLDSSICLSRSKRLNLDIQRPASSRLGLLDITIGQEVGVHDSYCEDKGIEVFEEKE